jgi:hypothetical protein
MSFFCLVYANGFNVDLLTPVSKKNCWKIVSLEFGKWILAVASIYRMTKYQIKLAYTKLSIIFFVICRIFYDQEKIPTM